MGKNHFTTGLLEPLARAGSHFGAIGVEQPRAARGSGTLDSLEGTRRTQLQATRAAQCPEQVKGLSKRGMVSS